MQAVEKFRHTIERAGLTVPEMIHADGKLHRFASNGDRADDAGWYLFFPDGVPAGAFAVSKATDAAVARKERCFILRVLVELMMSCILPPPLADNIHLDSAARRQGGPSICDRVSIANYFCDCVAIVAPNRENGWFWAEKRGVEGDLPSCGAESCRDY